MNGHTPNGLYMYVDGYTTTKHSNEKSDGALSAKQYTKQNMFLKTFEAGNRQCRTRILIDIIVLTMRSIHLHTTLINTDP